MACPDRGTPPVPQAKERKSKRGLFAGLAAAAAVLILLTAALGIVWRAGDREPRLLRDLTQSNLDALYLGRFSPSFMRLAGAGEEDCRELYENGLALEADYFCRYWSIEEPTDSFMEELTGLYKEIYAQARYELGEAVFREEGRYTVPVQVWPLDIMQKVSDRLDGGALDALLEKYAGDTAAGAVDEEAYLAYDREWAQGILSLVKEALAEPGYLEPETIELELRLENGSWALSKEGMDELDLLLIYYP